MFKRGLYSRACISSIPLFVCDEWGFPFSAVPLLFRLATCTTHIRRLPCFAMNIVKKTRMMLGAHHCTLYSFSSPRPPCLRALLRHPSAHRRSFSSTENAPALRTTTSKRRRRYMTFAWELLQVVAPYRGCRLEGRMSDRRKCCIKSFIYEVSIFYDGQTIAGITS